MEPYTTKGMVAQLQSLRPILLTEHGHSFLDLFDEFMRGTRVWASSSCCVRLHSPTKLPDRKQRDC